KENLSLASKADEKTTQLYNKSNELELLKENHNLLETKYEELRQKTTELTNENEGLQMNFNDRETTRKREEIENKANFEKLLKMEDLEKENSRLKEKKASLELEISELRSDHS